jgi:squalene cyclase
MTAALLAVVLVPPMAGQQPPSPEQRAIAFLAEEVPRWSQENHCFSCHNNGDGARALYAARQNGFVFPDGALAETTRWLIAPENWDSGPQNPAFNDKKLIRVQFAASLAGAYSAGVVQDRQPLIEAAASLLPFQEADGSWQVRGNSPVGSPATYGPVLASYMARRSLEQADPVRFAGAIAKANRWLASAHAESNVDTAALVLALPAGSPAAQEQLRSLLSAQNGDGGWGPHAANPSEAFDTALALLALNNLGADKPRPAIARGREFLLTEQLPSGGWPETTRPSGGTSYAQHISTTAWATLALLATNSER